MRKIRGDQVKHTKPIGKYQGGRPGKTRNGQGREDQVIPRQTQTYLFIVMFF